MPFPRILGRVFISISSHILLYFLQVDAEVFWKILSVSGNTNTCEKEFDVNKLKSQNKNTLLCLSLPSKVRNSPPKVFQSQKSAILQRLQG